MAFTATAIYTQATPVYSINHSVTLSGDADILVFVACGDGVTGASPRLVQGAADEYFSQDVSQSSSGRSSTICTVDATGFSAGSATFSASGLNGGIAYVLYEVQGVLTTGVEATGTSTPSNGTSPSVSVTSVTNNAALFAGLGGGGPTVDGAAGQLDTYVGLSGESGYGGGAGHGSGGSAGSQTCTLTTPSTLSYCAMCAVAIPLSGEIPPVDVTLTFSDVQDGSEVRIYEVAHQQVWRVDFAGVTDADCDGTYLTFQVADSGADDHYLWFDLDDGSSDPSQSGTGHEVDVTTGDDDEDIAAAARAVLDGIANLSATVSGTVVTVINTESLKLAIPTGDIPVTVEVVEEGNDDSGGPTEIDGIESTSGDWVADITVASPRRIVLQIMHVDYKFKRLEYVIGRADAAVPAGALQVEDLVYDNPS